MGVLAQIAACKFHTEDRIPFSDLSLLFKQWMTYVRDNSTIDINQLDYAAFRKMLGKGKQDTFSVGEIYNDGVVSIRRITDFDQMKKLPFDNYWCVRKPKWWKEYKEKEPPAEFLLVTNKKYKEGFLGCKFRQNLGMRKRKGAKTGWKEQKGEAEYHRAPKGIQKVPLVAQIVCTFASGKLKQ